MLTVTGPTVPLPLKVAPDWTVTIEAFWRLPVMFKVPAVMATGPVKELLVPLKVTVPLPDLVRVPEPLKALL